MHVSLWCDNASALKIYRWNTLSISASRHYYCWFIDVINAYVAFNCYVHNIMKTLLLTVNCRFSMLGIYFRLLIRELLRWCPSLPLRSYERRERSSMTSWLLYSKTGNQASRSKKDTTTHHRSFCVCLCRYTKTGRVL